MRATGPRSVTVPGAVAGWAALAERYGRLGLDAASPTRSTPPSDGFAVAPRARLPAWAAARRPARPAAAGRRASSVQPELGATLRRIADGRAGGVLPRRGRARRSAAASLARGGRPRRVRAALGRAAPPRPTAASRCSSCRRRRRASRALEGLGLLERSSPALANQIRCVQLALEDAFARVRDGADVGGAAHARRTSTPAPGPRGAAARARRRHRLPLRGRRRPDGRLVHPEPVRRLRLGHRRAGHGRRAAEPRRLLRGRRARSSRAGGRTTRSSRACCSATASCSARSASWAASSRRRPTCSSSPRSSTTASTRRRRSTGRASGSTASVVRLEEGLWDHEPDLAAPRLPDRPRDRRVRLRRRPGDPRLGRRPRRRLRPAQGRLRGGVLSGPPASACVEAALPAVAAQARERQDLVDRFPAGGSRGSAPTHSALPISPARNTRPGQPSVRYRMLLPAECAGSPGSATRAGSRRSSPARCSAAPTSTVSPTRRPSRAAPSGEEGDVVPEPPRPEISTSRRPPSRPRPRPCEPTETTSPVAALDDHGVLEPGAQDRDLPLQQALLVLRGVVLEVLGEVAVPARGRDRLDDLLPLRALELGELGGELVAPILGEISRSPMARD